MIFRRELAEKVMAGEKTVTRRLLSENPRSPWHEDAKWPVGKVFTVQPGRGIPNIGHARVLFAAVIQLGYLWTEEAQAEGCASVLDFEDVWRSINGVYRASSRVWCIRFEAVR